MNEWEMSQEIKKVETDKKIIESELCAMQNKWADYVLRNKNEICLNPQPVKVTKTFKAKRKDFFSKIKRILGLTPKRKEDGIETYLQYRADNE